MYDDSEQCPVCLHGRRLASDLVLDLRRVPKKKDIARTIWAEWIISQRLAELWEEWGVTGYELRPVRHKGYYRNEAARLSDYPTGRRLIEEAEKAGCPYNTWEFYVWLNKAEQRPLLEQVDREHAERREKWYRARYKPPVWYQLVVTSNRVRTSTRTRAGVGPFGYDAGRRTCEHCGVTHLGSIDSELFVERDSWDGSDVAVTAETAWGSSGWLMPYLLVFSPRLFRLMREHGIKGWEWEVAHLV